MSQMRAAAKSDMPLSGRAISARAGDNQNSITAPAVSACATSPV
jgi:hypothetical protein